MSSSESSYSETNITQAGSARPRPTVERQSTDNLLDYYQSAHAGQPQSPPQPFPIPQPQTYNAPIPRTHTRPLGPRAQGSTSSYYSNRASGFQSDNQEDKQGYVSPTPISPISPLSPTSPRSFQQTGLAVPWEPPKSRESPKPNGIPAASSFYGPSVALAMNENSHRMVSSPTSMSPPSEHKHPKPDEQALRQNLPITEPDSDFVPNPRPPKVPNLKTPIKRLHPVAESIMGNPVKPLNVHPSTNRPPINRSASPTESTSTAPDHNHAPSAHATIGPLPNPPRHIKTTSGLAPPPRPPRLHSPAGRRTHNSDSVPSTSANVSPTPSRAMNLPPTDSISPPSSRMRTPSPFVASRGGSSAADRTPSSEASSYKDDPVATENSKQGPVRVDSPSTLSSEAAHSEPVSQNPLQKRKESREPSPGAKDQVEPQPQSQSPAPTHGERPGHTRALHSREGAITGEEEMTLPMSVQRSKVSADGPSSWKPDNEIINLAALPDTQLVAEPQDIPRDFASSPAVPEKEQSESVPEVFQLDTHIEAIKDYLPPMWSPDVLPVKDDLSNLGDDTERLQFIPLKKLSLNPPCLQYDELPLLSNSIERIRAYTRKLNEMAGYDTGLQDWMAYQKDRRGIRRKPTLRETADGTDAVSALQPTPRTVSHGSAASEVTFPIRADAYAATDLTPNSQEDPFVSTDPANDMPYPSLVQGYTTRLGWSSSLSESSHASPSLKSVSTITSTGTVTSTTTHSTNFFTPKSKKLSKKDKSGGLTGLTSLSAFAGLAPSVTGKLWSQQSIPPQPRPVNLPPAPLRGGPRARPQRPPSMAANRGAIHIASPTNDTFAFNNPHNTPPSAAARLSRSPSLPASPPRGQTTLTPEDFQRQMNRLADVLPHVNRNLLAGYLRHSGQDILAIGQYIEDEKRGSIHYEYLET